MSDTSTTLVPFSSSLRHRVRAVVVRAPEVQDARFAPGPCGAMPRGAIDHAERLLKSGLRPNQVKYFAELHPAGPVGGVVDAVAGLVPVPTLNDLLGDAALRLEPASFTAPVSRSWSEQTVDAAGAARAETDEVTAARLGLALPPAFFALGTTLVDVGVENARKSRDAFEALPRATEACAALEAEVVAEDRKAVAVGLSDLKLTPRGLLSRDDAPEIGREGFAYGVEEDAMARLQSDLRAKLAAGGDLGVVTGLRFGAASRTAKGDETIVAGAADTWNRYAAVLKTREAKGGDRKQVSLLTRMVEVGEDRGRMRQVFAAVSEKYGEVNAGKIAGACAALCEGIERRAAAQGKVADVRAEVVYDRSTVAIDLITHTNVVPDMQTVGELFQGGLRVTSDDTGGGSLKVRAFGRRVACRNYTIVSADGAVTMIRHIGDPAHLLGRLNEALQASSGALATFAVQWGKACGREAAQGLLRNLETERKRRGELEDLVASMLLTTQATSASAWHRQQAEVLDGIYRSILVAHDLAPAKLVEDEVTALRRAYHDPRNAGGAVPMSPAAISNGLTLRAQDWGRHTADAAESLAGRIVSGDEVLAWIGAPAAKAA